MANAEVSESSSPLDRMELVKLAVRAQRPVLLITLILYALLQSLYVTATPLQIIDLPDNVPQRPGVSSRLLVGIGPDEKEYLLYIRSLAERGALPAAAPKYRVSPDDYVSYQVQHPPLFFALASLIYKMMGAFGDVAAYWYFMRFACALCGAGVVVLASQAAATAFPKNEFVVLAAAPTLAFLPIFGHMCGNLSSEPFEMLLSAFAWLQMIDIVSGRRPRSVKNALILGATVGLAMLSKLTAVILIPAALIALLAPVPSAKKWTNKGLVAAASFLAPLAVLVGPWFLHNRSVFGAWFPRPFDRPQLAGITLLQYLGDVNQPLAIAGLPRPMVITPLLTALSYSATAWTPFWLIQFYLPGGLQTAPAWQAIGLLAIVIPLLMLFLHASRSRREPDGRDDAGQAILWMAGSVVTFAVVGVLQQQLYADWDAIYSAGRYFVAAAPAGTLVLLFALSTGLRNVQSKQRVAAAVLAVAMFLMDLSTALLVRHFYADHPSQPAVQRIDG